MLTKLFTFLTLILAVTICNAQQTIIVDKNPYVNIGKQILFKEDTSGKLTYNQIDAFKDDAFTIGKNEIFNGGTLGKVWWAKLKYKQSEKTAPFLVIGYGSIDFIDIYYKDNDNRIRHIQSGNFADKNTTAITASEYIFRLPEVSEDEKEIYIRAKSVNTLILPIKLVTSTTLTKALIDKYIWQLMYVGIALTFFLFNLFMLFYTRERLHGLYMIRIVFLFYCYVLGYLNGYANFFNPQISRFILIHAQAFAAVGFIATIYFNNSYLSLKETLPKSIKWFNFLIILWVLLFVLSIWDTRFFTNRAAHLLLFVTSVSIIYTSVKTLQNSSKIGESKYILFYLIGWIPICLATIYILFALIDIIPIKTYTFNVLSAAGIIEGLLITLALIGDRFTSLRKGKEKAELESLVLIQERNNYLEEKIKEHTAELQLANAELKESSAFKDKLFSIIAHDMRTPLSSLKMVLQLSDVRGLSPENLSMLLENIRKNTEQVQKTMDNLLNWSISQMKLRNYEPEHINVHPFLVEHINLYSTLAEEKKITTELNCLEHFYVYADKNQLSLIFRNLMDNAVKFTSIGGFIEVGLTPGKEKYLAYIKNSGAQISEEMISRILSDEQNSLLTSVGTKKEKGTGLGLQLCKEFIQNLESTLKIHHEKTADNTFTVLSFEIPIPQ